jgi:hypothetical protein
MTSCANWRRSATVAASFDNFLEHPVFQAQLGIHRPQATILFFQFFQAAQRRCIQAAILGFPFLEAAAREPVLAAQIGHRNTGLSIFKDLSGFRESLAFCVDLSLL